MAGGMRERGTAYSACALLEIQLAGLLRHLTCCGLARETRACLQALEARFPVCKMEI